MSVFPSSSPPGWRCAAPLKQSQQSKHPTVLFFQSHCFLHQHCDFCKTGPWLGMLGIAARPWPRECKWWGANCAWDGNVWYWPPWRPKKNRCFGECKPIFKSGMDHPSGLAGDLIPELLRGGSIPGRTWAAKGFTSCACSPVTQKPHSHFQAISSITVPDLTGNFQTLIHTFAGLNS